MQLKLLLGQIDALRIQGGLTPEIDGITRDSREADARSIFVAVSGAEVDGHRFVPGIRAPVVVVDRPVQAPPGVTVVQVADTRVALAQLSAALYGFPSRSLPIVGITGTNGKTTVATLVDAALSHLGWITGRIGTTGNWVAGVEHPTRFTTPEAPQLQALLAKMRDAGAQAVAMEVSSHGLAQHRVDGIAFTLGVFTNLTQDHLDFHGTFEAYRDAKARLFRELLGPPGAHPRALVCGDDPAWEQLGVPADRWRYGRAAGCEVRLTELVQDAGGTRAVLQTPDGPLPLRSDLVGPHNALNLAAAWSILRCLGIDAVEAIEAVGSVQGVPGRLERIPDPGGRLVVVDFAHSEDALQNVLEGLRPLTAGRLWVVFGCGGDRDPGKRPRMGAVATGLADRVVITSDNPRSEDPLAIIEAIRAGVTDGARIEIEPDRAAAIALALHGARPGDTVLVAGKGHETYQEIAGVRHPFDDRQIVRAVLEEP
ncbi:MAG TPA: UDP-N-acetylmuramoyl-L-alanyl-D-glutamate--2,6-diaminopimelate ligase [Deltaproteobacteria bacterium]|nr:UDP-N-acetylmuramoyl-L-alanyl-D-glutamate--2,6-diaminopimelate ligase [Deltaproteobacteria bacterium]